MDVGARAHGDDPGSIGLDRYMTFQSATKRKLSIWAWKVQLASQMEAKNEKDSKQHIVVFYRTLNKTEEILQVKMQLQELPLPLYK